MLSPLAWLILGAAAGAGLTLWWLLRRQARLEAQGRRALRAANRRVEAEQTAAAALAARLEAVEQVVSEALIYWTKDGRLAGASPAARQWFELDLPAAEGPAPLSPMAVLRSAELAELVALAAAGEGEPRLVRHGGRSLLARATGWADGGVVLALRDQTELERLARARRDLVTNVSHDLRTPLTSISLMVDALGDGALQKPKLARRLVAGIAEQVAALGALVEGLVDLDRIESGHAVFQLRPTHLPDLIAAVTQSLEAQARQREVAVALDVPDGLWVLADPGYVGRALTNLLDNAIRFSPAGATVGLGVRADAPRDDPEAVETVTIAITDEGPGVPPAELDRIFERFYRADRSRSGAGSGLGLAIARHVVEGHGGRIEAENRASGGAEFRVTLPRAAPPADAHPGPPGPR